MSLPSDMVADIRATAGDRAMSAYVERAVRHEMLANAAYPEIPADVTSDIQTLADEVRGWTNE